MNNQKSTTSRALAFWLGLSLHLALGVALYHKVNSQPTASARPAAAAVSTSDHLAKP